MAVSTNDCPFLFALYIYLVYNSRMIRVDIYITKKQREALKALNELSLSEHIRRAIDEYLARKENK